MPGALYLPYLLDTYPTTHVSHTYPDSGHRLHHFPLTYIAHNIHTKFHDEDEDVHVPKADVRETPQNFHVEVELPGVKDHAELKLRWTSDATLMLTSKITRPEISKDELVGTKPVMPSAEASTPAPEEGIQSNGEPPNTSLQESQHPTNAPPTVPTSKKDHTPHLTLHERQIGPLGRAFAFPVPIDRDGTHAKLDAGVLSIVVPKIKHAAPTEEVEKHFLHVPVRIFGHEKAVHSSS
jgi:HSP20 family molecular chaperone IbpA